VPNEVHRQHSAPTSQVAASTDRGLRIVSAIGSSSAPMSAHEVAAAVGMPRATVYRILEQLIADRWVNAVDRPRRFSASINVGMLGLQVIARNRAREVTLSNAIACAQSTGRTCVIGAYDDGDAIFLDGVAVIADRVMLTARAGRVAAACNAVGKILLAYQPQAEMQRVAGRGLPRFTSYTKTDPRDILDDLAQCRSRGFAVNDRESGERTGGIAAPVFDQEGNVVMAIGVDASVVPLTETFISQVAPTLAMFGARASVELGYQAATLKRFV
jgi:DNA-binding IclR family transcriptional regulator